jgi:protease-4
MADNDPDVKNTLFHYNSPGGTVTGVYEAGSIISKLSKPTFAYTETQMCSAAYWLGSKSTNIIATPSASLGSIGVYMALIDSSEKMQKEGLKLDLIKSGEFKAMGIKPLTESERAILQERVEQIHDQFRQEVNMKRSVSAEYMEGLTYTGVESIENGLSDALVYSLPEALEIINS